ncbi:hypothetical protein RDI58_027758 [Solanum bulbocastanum]|uniref:Uncharacterized protein n=1 Tax=Solanum bulbocastanum TaxID=147425 RepID=A0AAN8Y2M0_SOLBU
MINWIHLLLEPTEYNNAAPLIFKSRILLLLSGICVRNPLKKELPKDSSTGSLPESLSSWISNPNNVTDALESEKSTTTGDAFDFYPATQTETTDETVVFGSKDIIDPGPPVCDSELEEIEEELGPPLNAEITEGQQLNAEITEGQQLNAEIPEEQQENDQQRREDMVEFTGCMYPRPKLIWKNLAKCITGKTIAEN